ncbi:hypothetical protein ACFL1H_01915 [Nanoarchaeota archaeon]
MSEKKPCEFYRKTCWARCDGHDDGRCSMRKTNLAVYKGQGINSHMKIETN